MTEKFIEKIYRNDCFKPNENSKFLKLNFEEIKDYFVYKNSSEELLSKYYLNGKITNRNININFKTDKRINNELLLKLGLSYSREKYPKIFELLNDENFAILFAMKFNLPKEILIVSDFLRMEFFVNELLELPSVKGLIIKNIYNEKNKNVKENKLYKNININVFGNSETSSEFNFQTMFGNSKKTNSLYAHGSIIDNQYIRLPKDFEIQLYGIPGFKTKIFKSSPAKACTTSKYNEYIFNIRYSFKSSDYSKKGYRHFFKDGNRNKKINYSNYNKFYKNFTFSFFHWTNSLRKKITLCDLIRFIKRYSPNTKKLKVNSCLGSNDLIDYKDRFHYYNGSKCYEGNDKKMKLIIKQKNGTYKNIKPSDSQKRKRRSMKSICVIKQYNTTEEEYNKSDEFCLVDKKNCDIVPIETLMEEDKIPKVTWANDCFNNSFPILYNFNKNKKKLFNL